MHAPALRQKTVRSCAKLLAVAEQAEVKSVKCCLDPSRRFVPNVNLNFGLRSFSDLLKLLVCGIFASWTDASYVGYASGTSTSGPIKKSRGHRKRLVQLVLALGLSTPGRMEEVPRLNRRMVS